MKKLLLLFCLIFTALVPVAAQNHEGVTNTESAAINGAAMEFNTMEHNFGRILERGRKVSYTFRYTNTGTKPLIVTRVSTTCRCVDYNYSRKPVAPGETGSIIVSYNPRKQEGVFHKVIQIFDNTPEQRHVITIRGEVVQEDN